MGGKTHCMNGQIKGNAVHGERIASRVRHVKRKNLASCQHVSLQQKCHGDIVACEEIGLLAIWLGGISGIMRLSDWLQSKGLTQSAFAKLVDVSPATICKILNGDRSPSKRLIRKIHQVTLGRVAWEDWTDYEQEEESQGRSVERTHG
jgi:DNA-binding XRE family transcriptional regulator